MTLTMPPPTSGPSDGETGPGLAGAVAAARASVAGLIDLPAFGLSDSALVDGLAEVVGLRSQVDELTARLAAEVDCRGLAHDRGVASTASYVAAATGLPRPQASMLVARGRLMSRRCEPTRHAWGTGALNGEQAEVIARAVDRVGPDCPAAAIEAGQHDLAAHAAILTLEELKQVANRWVEVIDPDGADTALGTALEAEEHRARAQATFTGRAGLDGLARFSGRIPNLQFAMLKRALEAVASPRRTTRDETGPADIDPVVPVGHHQPSALGHKTRLGLALCELIEHLPTDALPQHGATNATVVVTVDHDTLRDQLAPGCLDAGLNLDAACADPGGAGAGRLDDGTDISAGQTRRLACNAAILPAVLAGDSHLLDLGRSRRLFNRHQRLALTLRDQGCIWPHCDRPAAWCEAHHLTSWADGGPTDLANAALVCAFHHHLLHSNDGWTITMATNHRPAITPPVRLDPTRTPQQHHRFRQRGARQHPDVPRRL